MSDPADSTLIEAAIEGNRTAFAELVRRYWLAVLGTVRRTLGNSSEAEDAVQEVFMRALVFLPKYDRRYPFAPWILKIACNHCIDQLRRRKARKYKLWSDLSEAEERKILSRMSAEERVQEPSAEESARHLEIARALLDQLKTRRRMAFILREIDGRSYAEVASILGTSEASVRVRVWRARADLHEGFRNYLSGIEKGIRNEKSL